MSNLSPEFALLGLLAEGPSHGYDLHQRLVADLGHVWHLSQSQAYAILKRLETRGDIRSHTVEQEKLPARQKLQLTAQGRRRFQEWLDGGAANNARSIRLEFLTRLYFAQKREPEKAAGIYIAQFEQVQASIQRLTDLLARLPPEQTYNRLSLDLRLRQMHLIGAWLDEIKIQFQIEVLR
jgi:DNA-binding PadR family transcriptional regulator